MLECDMPKLGHFRLSNQRNLRGLCEPGDVAYVDCPQCGGVIMVNSDGKLHKPSYKSDNQEPEYEDERQDEPR